MNEIKIIKEKQKECWICYIDLLGFTDLVLSKGWINVFSAYSRCLEELNNEINYKDLTNYTWFSDTFILYTRDDSSESFLSLEQKVRWFVFFLISYGVPLRGSISFGDFYADDNYRIYFGKGLIEAYRYGENQDWIGMILSPSTVEKLKDYGLNANELMNYVVWEIPFKSNFKPTYPKLPAYRIGEHSKYNNKNVCLEKLTYLANRIKDKNVKRKYERTIDFIKENTLY